jgi:hypothetical protein
MKGTRFSLQRGTDHQSAARAGSRRADGRGVPASRAPERNLLPVEVEVRRPGGLRCETAQSAGGRTGDWSGYWPPRCSTTRSLRTCLENVHYFGNAGFDHEQGQGFLSIARSSESSFRIYATNFAQLLTASKVRLSFS